MSGARTSVETVVIGAGHSGLIASWHLGQAGREHIVLERRPTLGGGWQDRWDAFCLVTPNELVGLPGFPYDGPDPDGFLPRDEIVRGRPPTQGSSEPTCGPGQVHHLEAHRRAGAARFHEHHTASSTHGTSSWRWGPSNGRRSLPPGCGAPPRIVQLHSHDYRRPADLPPGGVLIVGPGNRRAAGRGALRRGPGGGLVRRALWSVPRRYRGRD